MNTDGRYKGMTAEEFLLALSERGEDEGQMVGHARSVLVDLEKDRDSEIKALDAEYATMHQEEVAAKLGNHKGYFPLGRTEEDPESFLKKMAKQRKVDFFSSLVRDLRAQVKSLPEGLRDKILQKAPFDISAELQNQEESLAAIEKLRSDLASLEPSDKETKLEVDGFLRVSATLIENYKFFISQEPSRIALIFDAAMNLNKGQDSSLRDSITERIHRIQGWDCFTKELSQRLKPLEDRASLMSSSEDTIDASMRINWLGGRADLKILMDFLLNNQYINTSFINKYIAQHFLIEGKRITAKQVDKFKSNDAGSFEINDNGSLSIPVKRTR